MIFWKPIFFYMLDDWTALIQMVQYPFGQYLLVPDGEQWFPLFHLIYYGLVKIAGLHYSLLVLVNCLGTGVNALLVYCFLRRHWEQGLALSLSLVYAVAAVHHAITWNAFYFGYLLSLGLFLGALLLTDSYARTPSAGKLWGIGLCAVLAVLSHNYPLVGLLALPLYVLLVGERRSWRAAWPVMGVIIAVYLVFMTGYLNFAGLPAATSHNQGIFGGLPGPAYLLHMVSGAFLAPFFYLFWGFYHFPIPAYIAGGALLIGSLAAIWRWGQEADRNLAVWALLVNLLPFFLISLTRYQRQVSQAYVARYGIFTLIGALLLVGTSWRLLAPRIPHKLWAQTLAGVILAVMVGGQIFSLPLWTAKYLEISRTAQKCYALLNQEGTGGNITAEDFNKFCPTAHPTITPRPGSSDTRTFGRSSPASLESVRTKPLSWFNDRRRIRRLSNCVGNPALWVTLRQQPSLNIIMVPPRGWSVGWFSGARPGRCWGQD
jgi:hypothetical protein